MLENMIVDRTLSDVETVVALTKAIKAGTATEEQVQQYLNVNHKGAYTYRDLNRVEAAVGFVAEKLHESGYLSVLPETKVWTLEDKPNEEDFSRYLYNVALLRNALTVWESTPEAPTDMVGFDVNKANALEQILLDVYEILGYMKAAWFYLGDLYSAEV